MENKRVVVTTSLLDLTSGKSSLYNEVGQRGGTVMVIIVFGIVLASILYLTIIVPIKMVLLALRMMR